MTTAVEFHTGVADPVAFACRLLRKAQRQGARVLVTAPPAALAELDAALWAFDAQEFLPHLRLAADEVPGDLAARTPIWLAPRDIAAGGVTGGVAGAPRLLVNVGADAPPEPSSLDRLIEIVGADSQAADEGRARWRGYRAAGLQITHHQASGERE